MGDRKLALIGVLFCFCLFVSMVDITYAPTENWVEVARFTGVRGNTYTTDYFICNHTEWRIRWECEPSIYVQFGMGYLLNVTTYPAGELDDYIDKIDGSSDSYIAQRLVGVKRYSVLVGEAHYIRDNPGKFYMNISSGIMAANYLIIVEQNTDSTSEDPSAYTSVTNWNEVARFTNLGTENGTVQTDFFTTDRAEWRIRWEIVPNPEPNDMSSSLHIDTYQKSDGDFDDPCIATIHDWTSSEPINGSSYFHYKKGTFYLDFSYYDLDSYTIIVEQDLNSIPEFPSWLILPLFLIASFSVIVLKKRLTSKN